MTNLYLTDMLIRIKNGYNSKLKVVYCKYNVSCLKVLLLLYNSGYINGYYFTKTGLVVIKLKYILNFNLFNSLNFFSTPGQRKYYSVHELYKIFGNKSFVIVSTTKGLLLHTDAILYNLGGEVLFSLNYL